MNCNSHNRPGAMDMVHNGEGSFFLEGSLDIDMPGEMMSSIIANRKKDASGENADIDTDKADETATKAKVYEPELVDKVLDILNEEAKKKIEAKEETKGKASTEMKEQKSGKDIIAEMYQAFLGKIGSYPIPKSGFWNLDSEWLNPASGGSKRSNRSNTQDVTIEDVIMFPCFDDQALFKELLKIDNPDFEKDNPGVVKGSGVLMGMLKYNFTILGNSGITHGDTFNIIGIPEKYKTDGFFQVTNVEHKIEGMMWTTVIEGQFRSGV